MESTMSATPQRPLVPPKPDKDKINVPGASGCKLSSGTQVNFPNSKSPETRKTIHNGAGKNQSSENFGIKNRELKRDSSQGISVQGPLINIHQKPPVSPQKPALPPKPVSNSVSSPPRKTSSTTTSPVSANQYLPKSANSVSIANSILANRNRNTLGAGVGDLKGGPAFNNNNNRKTDGSLSDSEFLRSPPPVLRRHSELNNSPLKSPSSEPVSPRPATQLSPRPYSSIFNFPSPEANLNNSSSSVQPPRNVLRSKSASLGRNSAPPSSSGGFFSNKALALARILPLDLHFGKLSTKTKSSTLPTGMQSGNWTVPIQSFKGKNIAFSNNSPIPPPPPPRLKKKLSPVNSLSPVSSLSPSSPPPVFSPPGGVPFMTSLSEEPAIYAEIDKEKKWADRKLKEEVGSNESPDKTKSSGEENNYEKEGAKEIQASLVISVNRDINDQNVLNITSLSEETREHIIENNNSELTSQENKEETPRVNMKSAEGVIVDSWLGKYLSGPIVPPKPKKQEPHTSGLDNICKDMNSCQIIESNVIINKDESKSANAHSVDDKLFISSTTITDNNNDQELMDNKSFLFSQLDNMKEVKEIKQFPTTKEEVVVVKDHPTMQKQNTQESPLINGTVIGDTNLAVSDVVSLTSDAVVEENSEQSFTTVTNVTTSEESVDVVKNESAKKPEEDEIPNPDTILQLVDTKIQSAVSLLSNLSGKVSPSQQTSSSQQLTSANSSITENFESLSITEVDFVHKDISASTPSKLESLITEQTSSSNSKPNTLEVEDIQKEGLVAGEDNSFIRRRSWNCSGDSSPCESSSSSLSNLRDRSFTYSSGRSTLGWVDEGEISTGALADAESSDAQIPNSSTEDIGSSGGSLSRRKRMWIFSSFGKPGSSSSGSSNGNQKTPKSRHKDKTKPLSSESNGKTSTLGRFGRQVSDSVLTTAHISGPMSLPDESSGKSIITKSSSSSHHPTVQFSPDVIETPIYRYRYSESSEPGEGPMSLGLPLELEKVDNESVSSGSSINLGCANVCGYEDILGELSPKNKKAFYVAREILTSEQTFVDVLNLLTVQFPRAIKKTEELHRQPVIPPHDMDNILAGLPTLKQVNEELKLDLEERIKNWLENPKLADIIVKKGPFLKLYAHYIKNFEKTTQHLDSCCQRYPGFEKALRDFEISDKCSKLGLKHYMLKPVQRMPQYRLLLEDYLKHLDETSNDYEDTIKAIAIVRDVAEHANEAIRLQVNAEKLMHLQNRLVGAIIMKADRQLLKEGELLKVCRKMPQPRFFALMNDCLLCMTYNVGAGSQKDLKMRNELPLTGMRVCLTATEDYQYEFSVISIARSFNLVAKSAKEREEWMKALNDAIHDNIKKRACSTPDQEDGFLLGKVAPVWIQDQRVTMCQICTAEFTVTFRRHHCRSCGKVVCSHCSGNQAPLQYLKNDAARVCDECYQYLLEEFDKESRDGSSDGLETSRDTIRIRFKKVTPNVSKRAAKVKSNIPKRLEVQANSSGSRISGYLHWRERKAWKRYWFVLMERVLYIYAASEDIVAIRSIPVLGWNVDMEKSESMDGGESKSVFKLTHTGQNTLLFQADNPNLAERWISAMREATILT